MATSLNKMALGILEFKMSRKQRFYYLITKKDSAGREASGSARPLHWFNIRKKFNLRKHLRGTKIFLKSILTV